MPLTPGTTLGPYEVLSAIGAGGMGEVYKARDTKLDRDVALKILPDAFVNDPERLARFQREAKVLASLNHPNIAAIYGLEESGDSPALVLEYVPGPTLQDRIAKGPIPLDEALPIARQIAEALEAAHEQGIIHRDLKPANVKVKDDGTVKVLDFGLAKALQPDLGDLDAANSPTMTMTAAATKMGVIMGTAAYMSPEQARAGTADRRSDIWAFGVVLLEMLTGKPTFTGKTVSDTLAFILTKEPDWASLAANTPAALRRLLRRCLEKEPKQRLSAIADARLDLDEAKAEPDAESPAATSVAQSALWQRPVPALAIGLVIAAVTGLGVWSLARGGAPASRSTARFAVVLPAGDSTQLGATGGIALSPNGQTMVYAATRDGQAQLFRRDLGELEVTPIRGTANGNWPFFSPDGAWIGFIDDEALRKVAVTGGAAVTLSEVNRFHNGASWSADGTIFVSQPEGVLRVSDEGGTPDLVIPEEPAGNITRPQLLPDGEHLLFTFRPQGSNWDDAEIVVESLVTGERRTLLRGGTDARYVPTGHLVYIHEATLLAVPFDLASLSVSGGAVPLVESVRQAPLNTLGAAYFAVSPDGALAYMQGAGGLLIRPLVWVDRQGREEAVPAEPRAYSEFTLSPDGSRVAVRVADPGGADVWVYDLRRDTLTRLTFDSRNQLFPTWTPDGRRLAFGTPLAWKAADGTGDVEPLGEDSNEWIPQAFSPDGTTLLFMDIQDGRDLGVLAVDDGTSTLLVEGEFLAQNGSLSPDGRWLAYQSNESGRMEVYVRPFPDADAGRWQVSSGGGIWPLWNPAAQEIFYVGPRGLTTVAFDTEQTFTPGTVTLLFDTTPYVTGQTLYRRAAVSPDGQRFLMIKLEVDPVTDDSSGGQDQIHVVLNWFTELQARVPTGR